MPKYLLLSIPLILALIVGLVAYQLKLASLDPPTEKQIEDAPVYREPDEKRIILDRSFDVDEFEKEFERKHGSLKSEDEVVDEKPPEEEEPKADQPETPKVIDRKDWQQNMRITRNNAINDAKKTGGIAAMIAAALGYIGLALYLHRLSQSARQARLQDALSGPEPLGVDAVTYSHDSAYDAEEILEPVPDSIDDEAPYEPYEPPIDISEIERAHDEDAGEKET